MATRAGLLREDMRLNSCGAQLSALEGTENSTEREQGKRLRGCEISKVVGFLKRKMNQLNVISRDFHHRTFRMPGTQYHAKSRLLVGDKFMHRRAMGMPVD